MSDTYTKLFASITESTIWSEPAGTRLVWITLLVKSNRFGQFYGSVPGLARLSNVSMPECEAALTTLLGPDKWSRTPDYEGRRIEAIDGGWRLLNYAKFDRMRSEAEAADRAADRKRTWDREHRNNRPNAAHRNVITPDVPPTNPDSPPTQSAPPVAVAVTVTTKSKEQHQEHVQPTVARAPKLPARFAEFWAAYPIRKGKAAALAKWTRNNLDAIADTIIADVGERKARDRQWLDGYAPHASTYVNQRGWEDEIEIRTRGPHDANRTASRNLSAVERVQHAIAANEQRRAATAATIDAE